MHSAEFPERKTKSDADSVDFGGRKKLDIQISFSFFYNKVWFLDIGTLFNGTRLTAFYSVVGAKLIRNHRIAGSILHLLEF